MKTFLCVLLCLSLAANAALLVRGQKTHPSAPSGVSPRALPPTKTVEPLRLTERLWEDAIRGDLTALQAIQNSGLPPDLVRSIIRTLVNERFAARERALYPAASEIKYWASNFDRARYTPKDRSAMVDLRREKEAVLDQLTPGWREDVKMYDRTGDFLPAEKAQRVAMIQEDYGALISNVRNEFMGGAVVLPSDREKLKYLEQESRKEMAQVLTPQELEEYDLRWSNTASMMRYQLDAFEATEEEFRSLVPIQKAFVDDKFSYMFGPTPPEERAARTKAQDQADAQIKSLLGDQRYADYVRSKDYEYQKLTQITNRLQLPKDRAVEAYNVKTSLDEKLQSAMKAATPEIRNQNVAALKEEADREFNRLLGSKGYEVFKQNNSLLQRIDSMAAPPPPKPPTPPPASKG